MNRLTLPLSLAGLLGLAACDNVSLAFDRDVTPNNPTSTTGESAVQVVPTGGDTRDGRPKVKTVAPVDGGWPATVPIVIEFSESVNQASIEPTSTGGTDGRIALRVQGSTQALPCQYDFLAGGRLLVMRPVSPLANQANAIYEVVLLPDARDVDGLRFQVAAEGEILTSFQVNQATSITDGRILATYPRDNQTDAVRESDYIVVFDRPANANTITAANLLVRQNGGSALAGPTDVPLTLLAQPDPRVVRFTPETPLAASGRFELVVDDTITFGSSGKLDFRGKTPFAVFETVAPQAPTAVHVANPSVGFPDKINRQNLSALQLRVTTPTDAQAGDVVVARIYGFERDATVTGNVLFVERTATVPAPGQQTVDVSFATALGTLAAPLFLDGGVDFAVQLQRGSQHSGYALNDPDDLPLVDVTPPTLTAAGPPGANTDIYTDTEQLAFHATASEAIGEAMLTDGVNPAVALFGSADSGFFTINGVELRRLAAPRPYTLTITDRAGNMAAGAVTGNIVQRGVLTGTVAGSLTVEAYDHATLRPLAGATVLVDPGVPTLPATGQLVGITDASGVATFTGLGTTQHTVTIVAAGYDLISFYNTTAARLSLPLSPIGNATATLRGNVVFTPAPGTTVLVGSNAFADPASLAVATSTANPTGIPSTPITANRAQVITAFGGAFEPTMTPTFALQAYQMLGPTLLVPQASQPPAAAGTTSTANLVMVPSTGTAASMAGSYIEDFANATGLDTANLVGGRPIVRVVASLWGFGGQVLAGVGFATSTGGAAYTINASYGLPMVAGFAGFTPTFWVTTQARDTGGRISQHRALLVPTNGGFINPTDPPGIPEITAPTGPASGSPLVTYADRVNTPTVPAGIGVVDVIATDPAGRRWIVLAADTDGATGTKNIQFPDLGTASVSGLATGVWSVRIEGRIFFALGTGATANSFVLSERIRQAASYARSAAQEFTIQ